MKKKSRRKGGYKAPADRRVEKKRRKKMTMKQKRIVLVAVILFAVFSFTYIRNIVRLTAENHRLKQQEQQLKIDRDRLEKLLENVDDADYIEERARKQLRLLNPDEILFTFDVEEDNGED